SDDPDIPWYGESVGKWKGGTLVVDSVGFKDPWECASLPTKVVFAATKTNNCRVFAGNPRVTGAISCLDRPAAAGSGIARCRGWRAAVNRTLARSESTSAMSAGH